MLILFQGSVRFRVCQGSSPPLLHFSLPVTTTVSCKGTCLRPPFPPARLFLLPLQLEEHVSRLREELEREREERNYFQLERDKVHTFWELTRRQLEEKRAELRNKDREAEEAEERHQVEIKVRRVGGVECPKLWMKP